MRLNIYKVKNEKKFTKLFSSETFFVDRFDKDQMSIEIDKYIPFYEQGIAVGVEFIGEINQENQFFENNDFSRGPALTSKESDDYKATSYFRYLFNSNKIYLFTEMPHGLKEERNLQLEIEVFD